ncbi:DNA modification methylase [Leucobacter sp. GX24907]
MKTRIASSAAIAAALVFGLTGCGLVAPQATLTPYAPSDGIDVNVEGAKVRNLMLIADESGENFNVVFTGVNTGSSAVPLTINFEAEGSARASADFDLEPGSTIFGPVDAEQEPVLISLSDVQPGESVTAYFQTPGGDEVERDVPVLDGTLKEYKDLVVSQNSVAEDEADSENSGNATNGDEGATSEQSDTE